ncbi:TPA: hypothetical protein RG501_RS10630 [Providencia rettgeri]|nr:hypothetical protein [Providencia rettgeri]
MPTKLLYSWRKRYEKGIQPSVLSLTERQELIVLRKENKLLKMEKEILKNCLHFAISPI